MTLDQCLQIFTARFGPTELKTAVSSPSGHFHNSSNTYSGISTENKKYISSKSGRGGGDEHCTTMSYFRPIARQKNSQRNV